MLLNTVSSRTRRRRQLEEVEGILLEARSSVSNTEPLVCHNNISSQSKSPIVPNYSDQNENTTLRNGNIELNVLEDRNPVDDSTIADKSVDEDHIPLELALREWKWQNNIKFNAMRELLTILNRTDPHFQLPSDPRTLMKTPSKIITSNVSGGQFAYFGIRSALITRIVCGLDSSKKVSNLISSLQAQVSSPLITISIGVDGIPLTKSTNKQFWPILGIVDRSINSLPFVIGLFYAETKPTNLDFLDEFVAECTLLEENGIFVEDKHWSFRVSSILADAPARSFIKACKSHNSYQGCEKCNLDGEWVGRVVYPEVKFSRRTDDSFKMQTDKSHHTGISSLTKLKIGLVSQVPLDYLHLVCLGVTRKLFRQWVKGKLPFRLLSRDSILIGERLKKMRFFFPSEFQRKPRSIIQIDHFKGTEFRTLLLYTGVVALRGIIPRVQYKNFLNFHTAMLILLSHNADNPEWNKVAEKLLKRFVTNCIKLYGPEFAVYNVHGLLHIHEDALLFGSLDRVSTFAFESFMQKIKVFISSHNYYLAQTAKRILEGEALQIDKVTGSNKIHNTWSPRKICRDGDNCFMLKSGQVVVLRKYAEVEGKFNFECQTFDSLEPLSVYPIDSTKLKIYEARNLSQRVTLNLTESDFVHKYIRLPYKDVFVCIPLLHTIK